MNRMIRGRASAVSLFLVASFALVLACASPPPNTCNVCGDGCVGDFEQCDDNSPNCISCQSSECGDGTTQPTEACDDGNQDNEDTCRNDCTITGCQSDADCSDPSEICLATLCQQGCRTNSDCAAAPPPGELCDISTCVPKPSSDADCASDEIFHAFSGACIKGCRTDEACQATSGFPDRICTSPIVVNATGAPCTCAAECSGSEICAGNCATVVPPNPLLPSPPKVCVQGCRTAAQCPPGQVCNEYASCADPCATNADCCNVDAGNAGDTCVGGLCLDACSVTTDCGTGTICSASYCVTPCAVDADCDDGNVCDAGNCVPGGCGTDGDCETGQVCTSQNACDDDSDSDGIGDSEDPCPLDPNNTCDDGCADDFDCAPHDACVESVCIPRCTGDTSCDAGQTCSAGICVAGSVCGDGNITGSEECDDGNQGNGDGCSSACTIE